jgi:hypothetical protein
MRAKQMRRRRNCGTALLAAQNPSSVLGPSAEARGTAVDGVFEVAEMQPGMKDATSWALNGQTQV